MNTVVFLLSFAGDTEEFLFCLLQAGLRSSKSPQFGRADTASILPKGGHWGLQINISC